MVKRFMWPQARQNFCKLNNKIIFLLYLNLDAQVSSAFYYMYKSSKTGYFCNFTRACTRVCLAQ